MAHLIEALIPVGIGSYIALLAFRVVGKRPGQDAKTDAWHAQYGGFLKVAAPLVVLFGVARLAYALLR